MTLLKADRMLSRAREAQPAWAALGVSRRSVLLGRLRREIAMQCESIAELIARETIKPVLDALSGDVLVTLEMMRYCEFRAGSILRPRRIRKPGFVFSGARFETQFEPHGVALIFSPSNYPFQLSMVPLITALAAGNTVVLKCSERTPKTAALIAKLCARAELPADVVQVSYEGPRESVVLIDAGPDIIFFTGGSAHGRTVAQRAAEQLIPVILELGGKDASLVFADCNLGRAVEGITYGAFSNAGRVCVGIKRVYVESAIFDGFVARLKRRIASLRVSTGADADLCPFSGEPASVLRAQVEEALALGATLQCPQEYGRIGSEPTLLTGVPSNARILTEECFGPVLCVAPFRDEAHGLALANGSAFALSGSVWTQNRARARRVATQLSAGSCAVNDVIRVIANPYAAFGGNRLSGYGRYHGPEGLRAFSRVRTIMLVNGRRSREINWFPFSSRTRRQLASLLRFRHGSTGLAARLSRLLMPLLLGAVTGVGMHAQSRPQTRLSIHVRLGRDAHGELAYLIFDSAAGFPDHPESAIRRGFLPIPSGAQQLQIEADLPSGTYAVSVYEDLNDNQKLDRNILGVPREPVGASNNPQRRMGPPKFGDCSFRLGDESQTLFITLVRGS